METFRAPCLVEELDTSFFKDSGPDPVLHVLAAPVLQYN
jgi:hypothetical protein